MIHKPPADDSQSYTVVETVQGNTKVTSYFTTMHRVSKDEADRELDEYFAPPTSGAALLNDTTQWLTVSVTSFRTLKYLWFILGSTSTLTLAAIIFIPVAGLMTYQFVRQENKAGKVLVGYRVALLMLGGLL